MPKHNIKPVTVIWETSRGKKMQIKDMADKHIENAMKKIKREKNWRQEFYEHLAREHYRRTIKD